MGAITAIQWADKTWSPWRGCTKIAPGCENCYAESQSKRNPAVLGEWGPNGKRVINANWDQPKVWNNYAERLGAPITVFPSLCDPFEVWVKPMVDVRGDEVTIENPPHGCPRPVVMSDVRRRFWDLVDQTPHIRWLILTKRIGNVARMMPETPTSYRTLSRYYGPDGFDQSGSQPERERKRTNVALIVSISDQKTAEENIPELIKLKDQVGWIGVSAEPLLDEVDLTRLQHSDKPRSEQRLNCLTGGIWLGRQALGRIDGIDWVIVGGESRQAGKCRPCPVDGIRSIVSQCQTAGVPVFVKQLGSRPCHQWPVPPDYDFAFMDQKHPKGGDPSEWPPDLQVQQFPW